MVVSLNTNRDIFAFQNGKLFLGLTLFILATFIKVWMYDGYDLGIGAYERSSVDIQLSYWRRVHQVWFRKMPGEKDDRGLQEKYMIPYLNARRSGMSHFDIAEKIFKVKLFQDPMHPHSYPLMSANTLRAFADVFFDYDKQGIKAGLPYELQNGDSIFVRTSLIEMFAREVLPTLPNISFVLITSYGDFPAPGEGASILDDPRLIRWFALNLNISHPKMEAIPWGLQPEFIDATNGMPEFLPSAIINSPHIYSIDLNDPDSRPTLVYLNFDPSHHKSRKRALEALKDIGKVELLKNPNLTPWFTLPDPRYYNEISKSKFMASPRGQGADCYRTWEAVMMGAIAIVENSSLNQLHEQAPTIIVDPAWNKSTLTREFLFAHSAKVHNRRIITADYWFEKINRARDEFTRSNK